MLVGLADCDPDRVAESDALPVSVHDALPLPLPNAVGGDSVHDADGELREGVAVTGTTVCDRDHERVALTEQLCVMDVEAERKAEPVGEQ